MPSWAPKTNMKTLSSNLVPERTANTFLSSRSQSCPRKYNFKRTPLQQGVMSGMSDHSTKITALNAIIINFFFTSCRIYTHTHTHTHTLQFPHKCCITAIQRRNEGRNDGCKRRSSVEIIIEFCACV